jgi:hypothetical protein
MPCFTFLHKFLDLDPHSKVGYEGKFNADPDAKHGGAATVQCIKRIYINIFSGRKGIRNICFPLVSGLLFPNILCSTKLPPPCVNIFGKFCTLLYTYMWIRSYYTGSDPVDESPPGEDSAKGLSRKGELY